MKNYTGQVVRSWHRLALYVLLFLSATNCLVVAASSSGYTGNITLDLARNSFSRYGSYVAFSRLADGPMGNGLYLRSVHGFVNREVLRIELISAGVSVLFRETASPTLLRLDAEGGGFVEICISEPNVVMLHGHGVGIRLTKIPEAEGFAFQRNHTQWEFNTWQQDIRFMLTAKQGNLRVDSDWDRTISKKVAIEFTPAGPSDDFEGVMEEFRGSWRERKYADSFQNA